MFFIIGLWKNLTKKYPVDGVKIVKMIGVTLRCKLIPREMFVGLGLCPVLPPGSPIQQTRRGGMYTF